MEPKTIERWMRVGVVLVLSIVILGVIGVLLFSSFKAVSFNGTNKTQQGTAFCGTDDRLLAVQHFIQDVVNLYNNSTK